MIAIIKTGNGNDNFIESNCEAKIAAVSYSFTALNLSITLFHLLKRYNFTFSHTGYNYLLQLTNEAAILNYRACIIMHKIPAVESVRDRACWEWGLSFQFARIHSFLP